MPNKEVVCGYSYDGRDPQNEIRDLLCERAGLLRENSEIKPRISSPIENAFVRIVNLRRIREIESRLDELAFA